MPQMNVSIPDRLRQWVETRVSEGRFASASDYIRDLIRRDQDRADDVAWVKAMIDDGLASETLEQDAFEVIDEIIAEQRPRREAA